MKNMNEIIPKNRVVPISAILFLAILIITLAAVYLLPANAQARKQNVTSDRYEINQSYNGGQAYPKDNNVWVYNQKFADTFGMPKEGIYPDLKGIEAAAFRVEDTGYKFCGMGGKAENCQSIDRCVIDVYIDEAKYPLPWATNQQADWLFDYNSTKWLRTAKEGLGRGEVVPPGVIPDKLGGGVRPFADPATHREAIWKQNAYNPGESDGSYNSELVYGFKRQAIAGLTMLSIRYGDLKRNPEKHTVTFRLESCEYTSPLKCRRFHEFQLPDIFNRKVDEITHVKYERRSQYYKSVFESINKP